MNLCTLFHIAAVLMLCAAQVNAADTPVLTEQNPLQLHLAGGESTSVEIPAKAGEFLEVVAQAGAGLVVRTALTDPGGQVVAVTPTLGGTGGAATIAFHAPQAGVFRLKVASQMFDKTPQDCLIRITQRRTASAADITRAAAHVAFARASQAQGKGSAAELRAAVAALDEPIRLAAASQDRLLEVRAVFGKGQFRAMAGDFRDAMPHFLRALELIQSVGDRRAEAHIRSVIALVHANLENYADSLEFYRQAALIQRELNQSWELALTLNNLAESETAAGRFDLALDLLLEQVSIRKGIHDDLGLSQAQVALADVYLSLGDFQQALEALLETVPRWKRLQDPTAESGAYQRLGLAYAGLGEYDLAAVNLARSVAVAKTLPDVRRYADALISTAQLQIVRGKLQEARQLCEEALQTSKGKEYRRGQALALLGLGEISIRQARLQEAEPSLREALATARSIPQPYDEAAIQRQLARVFRGRGDREAALAQLQSALTMQRTIGDRYGQVLTLSELALLQRAAGKHAEALSSLEEARLLIEQTRASLVEPGLRAAFLAARRSVYEEAASLLAQLGTERKDESFTQRAFSISEAAHARTLFESLSRNHRDQMKEVSLQSAAHLRVSGEREFPSLPKTSGDRSSAGETAALPAVQAALQPDELLLEYLVGPAVSHLWVVSRNRAQYFPLPSESVLSDAVEQYRNASLARVRIRSNEDQAQRSARIEKADLAATRSSRLLRSQLLPAAISLTGVRTLLIAADGPLHLVPFAALPDAQGRLLGQTTAIAAIPSAAVMMRLRAEPPSQQKRRWLVLADAVYSPTDQRVHSMPSRSAASGAEADAGLLLRSAQDVGLQSFPRLRMSRGEATFLQQLGQAYRPRTLLDFDAARSALDQRNLSEYSLIHIAAHTLVNHRHPELSGIVLSLVDQQGKPRPGFVMAGEISRMQLKADLVTLSACETTAGRDIRGEGLMSLSRAFLEAGARSVLATLWKVDDAATAQFMRFFYDALERRHETPAQALRYAQGRMRAMPEWSAPFYWAAFVLQGDWR